MTSLKNAMVPQVVAKGETRAVATEIDTEPGTVVKETRVVEDLAQGTATETRAAPRAVEDLAQGTAAETRAAPRAVEEAVLVVATRVVPRVEIEGEVGMVVARVVAVAAREITVRHQEIPRQEQNLHPHHQL